MTILAAAINAPETDQLLAGNARELVQRGGYGPATLFVDEEMFFGHMRMPLVELTLGQASTPAVRHAGPAWLM